LVEASGTIPREGCTREEERWTCKEIGLRISSEIFEAMKEGMRVADAAVVFS
jgi:hypothetical protein